MAVRPDPRPRPIVSTLGVPPHLTRASAGVRGVVVAVSLFLLHLPWHEASGPTGTTTCTGSSHYGPSLAILLGVGLASVVFARTSFGDAPPWSQAPIGLVSGAVSSFAAAAALSITSLTGHEGTATAVGKAAETFRAFQWVLVALGGWQVWLHAAVLLKENPSRKR